MTDRDVMPDPGYLRNLSSSRVELLDDAGHAGLILELEPPTEATVRDGWSTFTATLLGPASPQLSQATYRVRFADGRESWLFLVPNGESADSTSYTSTFTREAS